MTCESDDLGGNLGDNRLALGFVAVLHQLGHQVLSVWVGHKFNEVIEDLVEH
jgi:hypothetical protein